MLQLPPPGGGGRGECVSTVPARPLGEGGEERKSGSCQEKDEEGLDMTGASLITRFSRRCWWTYLLSVERTGETHQNMCVYLCVCVFLPCFITAPIPHSLRHSQFWPFTISPSGSYIHDRYREERAVRRKQICHRVS